ncbi:creatininase family protein [Kamptonema cortianum]|nr:creatininase family protein [Geitlerinema splendidum]MDK3160993.1 creatininase family protein [Kamptonema cortianum]
MKLAELTWQQVRDLDRSTVVLIPTGSLEQHGPHLPLFTDSILATAAAEGVEAKLSSRVLLVPTLWLGASGHHLAFPGSLSNSFEGYDESLCSVVRSLAQHGFNKFFVLNGHGGNTDGNSMAMRRLKMENPTLQLGQAGYFSYISDESMQRVMKGPHKGIRHACEAEVSLMMHVRPDLVRESLLRDDGLESDPPVRGLVWHFDEMTEEGSLGFATYASPETGRILFEEAVENAARELEAFAEGLILKGITGNSQ